MDHSSQFIAAILEESRRRLSQEIFEFAHSQVHTTPGYFQIFRLTYCLFVLIFWDIILSRRLSSSLQSDRLLLFYGRIV
jgi:hypothetical protein